MKKFLLLGLKMSKRRTGPLLVSVGTLLRCATGWVYIYKKYLMLVIAYIFNIFLKNVSV